MAGFRVELLLVILTGTVLLVSSRDWTPMNADELERLGFQVEPQTVLLTGDNNDDDDEGEGAATSDNLDFNHGSQVDPENVDTSVWNSGQDRPLEVAFVDDTQGSWSTTTDDDDFETETEIPPEGSWSTTDDDDESQTDFEIAPPRSWTSSTSKGSGLDLVCSETGFQITRPGGLLSEVKVVDSEKVRSIEDLRSCGYKLNPFKDMLTVSFNGCYVRRVVNCDTNSYSLQLLYDETQVVTASCERKGQVHRTDGQPTSKCKPVPPSPPSKAQNCAVAKGERLTCGRSGMSSSDCEKMGCCVDSSTNACYYPMDECTGDQHFVFAIRSNSAKIALDPTQLVIPRDTNCKPVIVNDKVAIFKFKVTECGTQAYDVGETKVYLTEVQSIVKVLALKYGTITRSDPLRFVIECRYSKTGSTQQSLASVGFMVKTPPSSLPSAVLSNGLYGVQLRMAKDRTYSSYFPTTNQPLGLLLGKPVYLELRLKSPKPDAVIIVNYCLAYPRSANNVLVLIYDGCTNPYEPSVVIQKVKNRYQRRFKVDAFQFMTQRTNKYLQEEIYFMCSAEVCRPKEKTCEDRCFGKA